MSISSLVKRKSKTEPHNVNQVWIREFTNADGQTVLLQLYSPSGGFTYPHRQFLGKLFNECNPKGYWVSRESFESALTRKNLRSAGKLKRNAWTLSALVNVNAMKDSIHRYFPYENQEEVILKLESDLIENLAKEKDRIIDAIKKEPGCEDTEFHFVKVDLTDTSRTGYEEQMAALGYFATNSPFVHVQHHEKMSGDQQEIQTA